LRRCFEKQGVRKKASLLQFPRSLAEAAADKIFAQEINQNAMN
jgi:hypothetical protein